MFKDWCEMVQMKRGEMVPVFIGKALPKPVFFDGYAICQKMAADAKSNRDNSIDKRLDPEAKPKRLTRKERLKKWQEQQASIRPMGRKDILKEIGFGSYAEYLKSDLWRSIRYRVLSQKGRRCKVCRCPATCIHHRAYDEKTMRGETLERLVPLCHGCHLEIEFTDGRKLSLSEANKKLKDLCKVRRRRTNSHHSTKSVEEPAEEFGELDREFRAMFC